MMLNVDVLGAAAEIVKPRDFYRPIHQTFYEAIVGLREAGEPTDARTVTAALAESGDLERVGGVAYVHTLIASPPTAANGPYYARIIADRAVSRRLVETGGRIAQLGYQSGGLSGGGVELDNAVDLAQRAVFDIIGRSAGVYSSLGDMLQPTLDDLEAAAGAGNQVAGVPTGLSDLDRLLNGLQPGQLIVVAGRPGLGKSTASMDFARNAAIRHKEAAAIFSLEMTKVEMVMRLLSAEALIPLHALRSGQLTDDDWSKLARRMAEIGEAPIVVLGQPAQRRRQAVLGVGDFPLVDQAAVVVHHRYVVRPVAPVPPDEHPRPPLTPQDTARSRASAGSSLLLALKAGAIP